MNPLWLPIVAIQGRWARSRIEVLPEAGGPTSGSTGDAVGTPLRLVVIGESTAAGCGASTHEEALSGALARALSERHDRSVQWTVHGRHGATIRRVRYRMIPELGAGVDVAVLLIGANDVLKRTPIDQWREELAAVVESLATVAERVVVAGIPPFAAFPSLPRLLRAYLAERGRALDDAAQDVCAHREGVSWIGSVDLGDAGPDFFARDGFHPSSVGYQHWAAGLDRRLGERRDKGEALNDGPPGAETHQREAAPESLPFVDEHSVVIAAPVADVWRTLTTRLTAWDNRLITVYVGAIGGTPPRARGSFPELGSALPGFAVSDVEHSRRLVLAGSHRFARYRLSFLVQPQGDRTLIRARSHSEFLGLTGRVYQAAVIGSGAHRTLMRRMLRSVSRDATADG